MNVRLPTVLRRAAMAGGLSVAAGAPASTPPPMWAGVERVLIDCRFDASIPSPEVRRSLCAQFLSEAARLTHRPVAMARAADLSQAPDRLTRLDTQLVLHIDARAADGGARPRSLSVRVEPERLGLNKWRGRATPAMPVALEWRGGSALLKRPVRPLAFYLSEPSRGPGRPPLKAPVRSDR